MAIYTRRGDKGKTSLYDSRNKQETRVDKDSVKIAAIGSIDELNSYLGLVVALSTEPKTAKFIKGIQSDLLRIGSILAGSNLRFGSLGVRKLELTIDKLENDLPVLANFIFPGGSLISANFQVARSVARRAEREVVRLAGLEDINDNIVKYLNRLSDYLFMAARSANNKLHIQDELWTPTN